MNLYRQGDVLIIAIDPSTVPTDVKPVPRERGRVVLAHGEATGHHHSILDGRAELLAPDGTGFVSVDEAAELYLLVHGPDPVELVHQEHDPILLPPGAYKAVRQRAYTPAEITRVRD